MDNRPRVLCCSRAMMITACAFIQITNLEKAKSSCITTKLVCHFSGLRCNARCVLRGQSYAFHTAIRKLISAAALCPQKSTPGPRHRASPSALMIYANAVSITHRCWALIPNALLFGAGIIYSLTISSFGKGALTAYTIVMPLVTMPKAVVISRGCGDREYAEQEDK